MKRIAAARCDACGEGLEYIDPRIHEIAAEQLACKKCGGMYDLATAFAKKPKIAAKKAPAKVDAKVANSKKSATPLSRLKAVKKKAAKKAGAKKK